MRTSPLESFQHYLQAYVTVPARQRELQPLAITISREAGAGAITIAGLVAERLRALEEDRESRPWAVFDANLAGEVLKDHHLPDKLERFMEETARPPVDTAVAELLGLVPSPWTLVQLTTETILRLASLGHVILVGRGANIITARMPQVFNVRLVAPWTTRVEHLARQNHVSHAEAARIAKNRDQARRAYVRRYFNAEVDDPTLYDLTVNTGRFGFANSADVIVHAALIHHREVKRSGAAALQNAAPDHVVP